MWVWGTEVEEVGFYSQQFVLLLSASTIGVNDYNGSDAICRCGWAGGRKTMIIVGGGIVRT